MEEPRTALPDKPSKVRMALSAIIGISATAITFLGGLRFIANSIIGDEAERFITEYSNGMQLYYFLNWFPLSALFGCKLGDAFLKKSTLPLKMSSWTPEVKVFFWLMTSCLLANIVIYKFYSQRLGAGDDADLITLISSIIGLVLFKKFMK